MTRPRATRRDWAELVFNRLITHIPFNPLRIRALKVLGATLGPNVYIFGGTEVIGIKHLVIAGNCHVGRFCRLDARGGLTIGTNAVIASGTTFVTAYHDIDDPTFPGKLAPIAAGDRVWIATNATVTGGVTIGEGAVVAAGAVVTNDVDPWTVVAGVPARPISKRDSNQTYEIDFGPRYY